MLVVAGIAATTGHGAVKPPKVTGLACVDRCGGPHKAATGATIRLSGRGLAATSAVRFPSTEGEVTATPASVGKRVVEVVVPESVGTGRPILVDPTGLELPAPLLHVVPADALPVPGSFALTGGSSRPGKSFFDARRQVRLRYRFDGYGALDLRATLERNRKVVRSWTEKGRAPFGWHPMRWNGLTDRGSAAAPGRYRLRVGPEGGPARAATEFRFYDHRFPVRGGHSYGDRFGVPRSGGRTHEGQDIWAGCGTRLEAARGGTVQFKGYSDALYGHYLVIDGRQTDRDYMYAHLIHPPTVRDGARVRTGEGMGAVGRSGNARGEGCQLHFELWPRGWHDGRPQDPLRELRRWDGYS